jgi:glycosyltransferase involved in cell wall biosynthesis
MKVVYWNNQPTPYVVARFNALADLPGIEFEAWFDEFRESNRSWEVDPGTWNFAWRLVPEHVFLGRFRMRLPLAELRAVRPQVFISNYDRLNVLIGAVAARSVCRRVALRVLPFFAVQSQPNRFRELAWRLLFRQVDGAKVPGPDGRRFAATHGLPPARTWPVTQSIDVQLYSRGAELSAERRAQLRSEWGRPTCVFVNVGRIVASKGVAQLLDAWSTVRSEQPGARLIIVGDGEDEAELRLRTEEWPDVIWAGFRQPDQLPELYGSCDALVFPTLGDPNGLVVEEAMAAGLPIITSDAAGDIRDRVPEPGSGYVVPAGDPAALSSAMLRFCTSPTTWPAMGQANRAIAARFNPTSYARDFHRFVTELSQRPRRRSAAAALCWALSRLILLAGRSATAAPLRHRDQTAEPADGNRPD